ncbi:hypothetical protein [Streptomyces sp. Tue6028]|uniref:hypothetical protein n=1 Tax=Streptomyces sp. Tue6028 TaxID=2036037 RepID=UPI003D719F22
MNVVGPGEPLEPVSSRLTPSVDSWVRAFRGTVMVPLLSGDDPLTLTQVAAWLTERAPGMRPGHAATSRSRTSPGPDLARR